MKITDVHSTAVVHPKAEIGEGVVIGPYAVIGPEVTILNGTLIGSHAVIDGVVRIGKNNRISPFVSIGQPPQDIKYANEQTEVLIGDNNIIREYATIHRATTKADMKTEIGSNNFIMAYSHIAHDCKIGNNVVMANNASLAGHVIINDYAILGGLVGLHQFVRVGESAFLGAGTLSSLDIPPYTLVAGKGTGNRAKLFGLNVVGLRRRGFSKDTIEKIKKAYRILFQSSFLMKTAIEKVRSELSECMQIEPILRFIETTKRGICR
ncbi:MAG TPA: acyl-ACP--UDP-N-acetylglucosamine O-acyltransferase [bacterium]